MSDHDGLTKRLEEHPVILERVARSHLYSFVLPLLLAVAGTALILVSTSTHGAGLSPDSVSYISAARSLSEGKGFVDYSNSSFVSWPPLFPAILAVPEVIYNADPVDSARIFNALVFGILITLTFLLLWFHLLPPNRMYTILAIPWILFSSPLLNVAVWAWTEPLFILLSLCFLRNVSRVCNNFAEKIKKDSAGGAG